MDPQIAKALSKMEPQRLEYTLGVLTTIGRESQLEPYLSAKYRLDKLQSDQASKSSGDGSSDQQLQKEIEMARMRMEFCWKPLQMLIDAAVHAMILEDRDIENLPPTILH